MKLTKPQAMAYFARPDRGSAGVLLYGPDQMRIALRRKEVIDALIGPDGATEMRLTRLQGADLRKDKAAATDAIKAIGFFPGPRVVHIEGANDQAGEAVLGALDAWTPGDAQLVVTAGELKPTSKIRKAFESHRAAHAIAIYPDPPGRAEIEASLGRAGVAVPGGNALDHLLALGRDLPPGDFSQMLEKLALYKIGDAAPVTDADIVAVAPASVEADVDDVLLIVSDGRVDQIAPVLRRLIAQGVNATTLCIRALSHFRCLHRAAVDTSGRPQIWGPNRDRMLAQARRLGAERLEAALTVLTDADLSLRSAGAQAPQYAVVERALVRLAMLAQR